jgi:hypothetical protein
VQVSLVQTRRFIELFVEERTYFHRRMPGESAYGRLDRYLVDQYIQDHLSGKYDVACPRADATTVLAVDLRAQSSGTETLFQRYQRVRALVPPSVVFWSGNEATLQMMWLLAEHVPSVPASVLLMRYLRASGIQVGTDRSCSDDHVRLPLGHDSFLVDPKTLDPLPALHDDPEAAIDFITALPKVRSRDFLSLKAPASEPAHTGASFPQAPDGLPAMSAGPPTEAGLSDREMNYLRTASGQLAGIQRRRQLQFLVDLVSRFKAEGTQVLPLPRRMLVQLEGSHSGSYQRRIGLAIASHIVADEGRVSHRRPRRFRLLLELDGRPANDVPRGHHDQAVHGSPS